MNYEFKINDEVYIFDGETLSLYKDYISGEDEERKVLCVPSDKLAKCMFIVTEKCNGNCLYCYEKKWKNYNNDMDIETADKILSNLLEKYIAIDCVSFFGGEPTLKFELIKYIVEKIEEKIKVDRYEITTNAALITDEMIDFFVKYDFKVVLSIDGPEFIHDKLRLNCKHSKVIKIIEKYKEIKKENNLFLHCTYTKLHAESISIDELEKYFEELGIKYDISDVFTDVDSIKLEEKKDENSREMIDKTYEELAKGSNFSDFNKYCKYIIEALVEGIYKEKFCYEIGDEFSIVYKSDGTQIPCNTFAGIENYDIEEIEKINSKNNEVCKNCWARGVCHDCVANFILNPNTQPWKNGECSKKEYYAYALEKLVYIMHNNAEKFQLIIDNYYKSKNSL